MFQNQIHFSVLRHIYSNRKTTIFFLILLTVSLASLGIRLPWHAGISSSSGKPKPRPRAVIQCQSKTAKQIFKSFSDSPAIIPERLLAVASSEAPGIVFIPSGDQYFSIPQFHLSPRAPPSLSFSA